MRMVPTRTSPSTRYAQHHRWSFLPPPFVTLPCAPLTSLLSHYICTLHNMLPGVTSSLTMSTIAPLSFCLFFVR